MTIEPRGAESARHLSEISRAFFQAVDPGEAVRRALKLEPGRMVIAGHCIELDDEARVYLVAIGKAAPGMAQAAASILGSRISQGVVTVPHGFHAAQLPGLQFISAGHPLPDGGSLAAGHAARRMLTEARSEDMLLALVSGGGSAMFEIPRAGISLADLRTTHDRLTRCAATIHEINLVRQSLSEVKGGGLAALAAPARTVSLLMSDVVADRLESIASGPTVPTSGLAERAHAVLERHQLGPLLPPSVIRAIHASQAPPGLSTPPLNLLVASNGLGLEAASIQAAGLGFSVQICGPLQGETHEEARAYALALCHAKPPTCLLAGGETTLVVGNGGLGGRNQSFALAAAIKLEGDPRRLLAAIASDGVDGPTDAAGAVVDGATVTRLKRMGLEPHDHLRRRDAYPALKAASALIFGGPTGTNVGDFVIGLAYA